MAFDNVPMTRPALMTAAAALALYDSTRGATWSQHTDAADALAAIVRANLAKLTPKAPKAAPSGFGPDLAKALAMIAQVVERRNTIPVLSNVLLDAKGDRLTLKATDMDMAIATTIDAPGIGTWATTVSAEGLKKLIGKGGGDVLLAPVAGEERLEVMVGNALSSLPTIESGDYPLMSDPEPVSAFTVPGEALRAMLAFIRPAVSTEETRYYLNGAYLHTVFDQGVPKLRVVATDGHRLNLDDMPAPDGADFAGVIIPRKAVDVLLGMLAGGEALVQVSGEKVRVTSGGFCLTSKVVEGAFPDYMRVIPRQNDVTYDVEAKAFAASVGRVSAVSQEKSKSIKLTFGSDRVTLACRNMEGGRAEETVEADRDPSSDDDIEIGFNGKYLAEAVAALGAPRVRIQMADAASPTLFLDAATPSRICVLMPLRV